MEETLTKSAPLAFTVATILLPISLGILNYAWKSLKRMVFSSSLGNKRIRFNIRQISDERERNKAAIVLIHFMGCLFISTDIACILFAMMGIASRLLGYEIGPYGQDNYEFGIGSLYVAILFFIIGFICISIYYLYELRSLVSGKPNSLIVDIETLPPVNYIDEKRRIRFDLISFVSLFIVMIVAGLLELFSPFNTLIKLLLILVLVIVYLILVALLRKKNIV